MKLCRHCDRRKASKPRGLCFCCFNSAARDLYPLAPRVREAPGGGRLPAEPTAELPGTPGKVRVMAERVARREALFHPDDAKLSTEDD